MDAAVLHSLGQAPRLESFPEPVASEGEVIVQVRAAALKPVEKQLASGTHYASPRQLPVVCGVDGVGNLPDGKRVFFGGPRSPYGAMAQRTVVSRAWCFPIPDGLDDATAAALPNPGVSAWLALSYRAKLAKGETVLILGATGVAGKLAVQSAKLLGAGRVIAAGRNQGALETALSLGAHATIGLDQSEESLAEAFAREAGDTGYGVIIDYLWGRPTETLLGALTRREFASAPTETRLVEVGESAGPSVVLQAASLRSTRLTIMGTAGIPPVDILVNAFNQVIAHGASGELRVDVERVPLAEVEAAWERQPHGKRIVIMP